MQARVWDKMTSGQLRVATMDRDLGPRIGTMLHGGGGNHEWIPVSRGVAAKILGLSAVDIQSFVSGTGETSGTRVITELDGTTRTEPWEHKGRTGAALHKRLFEIWESVTTAQEGRNLVEKLITEEFVLNDTARQNLELPDYIQCCRAVQRERIGKLVWS